MQQLAGGASFERGEIYAAEGRVRSLVMHGDALTAAVRGSKDYAVRLAVKDDALAHACSCPVGADGGFCKHCVATALAWLGANQGAASGESGAAAVVKLDDVRPFLLKQDKATLASWLLEAAERDERLRERLLREAARATGKGVNFAAYRRSIDRATETGGFVHYREAHDFTAGIWEAVEPLRELLREGHAAAVIALAEHGLSRVGKALLEMDDSDGGMSPILDDLQQLHLEACRAARPDPEELAARLFDWEINGEWDVFHGGAQTYADVLGEKGLAVYRARAEAEWRSLPALGPGRREDYSSRRFRVTGMMEALARTSGDLEALVAVKARDLSLPYHFLTIAELYRDAKQADAALDWAERGVKAFPDNLDPRLLEFLADEYHRRRRHDDALALVWRLFEARPDLEGYQRLKQHAERADAWAHWRERALTLLRRNAEPASSRTRDRFRRWAAPPDRSTLVSIFLWEKNADAAWQEAQAGGCTRELWLRLADAREKTHPADTLPIHLREAEALIAQKSNGAYEQAVRQLQKVKSLHLGLGQSDEWDATIARLRTAHKPKRNFIALAARL